MIKVRLSENRTFHCVCLKKPGHVGYFSSSPVTSSDSIPVAESGKTESREEECRKNRFRENCDSAGPEVTGWQHPKSKVKRAGETLAKKNGRIIESKSLHPPQPVPFNEDLEERDCTGPLKSRTSSWPMIGTKKLVTSGLELFSKEIKRKLTVGVFTPGRLDLNGKLKYFF